MNDRSTPAESSARASEALVGQGQRENYASADNLAKRQALFDFPDPDRSRGRPALDRIDWTGVSRVLDAGCGNGLWMRAVSSRIGADGVVGMDLSPGMLRAARQGVGERGLLVAGDVQRLPFGDENFDVVLCFWMLFHVEDHRGALEEFARVLRSGGHLLVTTNSAAPRRIDVVLGEALAEVTGRRADRWLPAPSFSAENGAAIVTQVFDRVDEESVVSAFAIPSAEPVLAAMESTRGPIEIFLGAPVDWDPVLGHARKAVEEIIEREGAFTTELATTSFLAEK